jgi:hypothetical protein
MEATCSSEASVCLRVVQHRKLYSPHVRDLSFRPVFLISAVCSAYLLHVLLLDYRVFYAHSHIVTVLNKDHSLK